MKIGIFGGSFNPPHIMHKKIALDLINNKILDKNIYVPTGNYYKKDGLIGLKYRYEMLSIMIKNNSTLEVSSLSLNKDFEYTYQVLDYFQDKYESSYIYFICGSDNLRELDTWNNYEYILENYKLIVVKRNNDDIDNILKKYSKYKDNIIITSFPENMVSSSIIRKDILSSSDLMDKDVLKYILEKGIY